jgi:hypothetical protein
MDAHEIRNLAGEIMMRCGVRGMSKEHGQLQDWIAAAIEQAEKDATERAARIADSFKGGFTLTFDGVLVPDVDGPWALPNQVAQAIRESPRPAPALCGVVGHPESGRMVCEREPHEAGTYHQQGAVRWLGYERPAPEPATCFRVNKCKQRRDHTGPCDDWTAPEPDPKEGR